MGQNFYHQKTETIWQKIEDGEVDEDRFLPKQGIFYQLGMDADHLNRGPCVCIVT